MSGWRTSMVVSQCLTCQWRGTDLNNSRRAAGQAAAHKRAHPDHQVVIDREQTRTVKLSPAPSEDREPNEDEWACDSCGTIAPAETEGWEQTPQDDAGVTVERCPDCRLHPAPSEPEEGK